MLVGEQIPAEMWTVNTISMEYKGVLSTRAQRLLVGNRVSAYLSRKTIRPLPLSLAIVKEAC